MRIPIDNVRGFYAIVDPDFCAGRNPLAVAKMILAGGCAVLQLRAKKLPDREIIALGQELARLSRDSRVLFFVNDRPDIALILDADGVHLGQKDIELKAARSLMEKSLSVSQRTRPLKFSQL